MSTFAIGDIHGHLSLLDRLLASLTILPDDTIVFLGDYVDRGPNSRGVVERVMEIKAERGDRCICLLGNHEDMMLDYWRRTRGGQELRIFAVPGVALAAEYGSGFWETVGGEATLSSYCGAIPEGHIAFIAGLPLTYEDDDFIFVHAGLNARGDTPRGHKLWGAPG